MKRITCLMKVIKQTAVEEWLCNEIIYIICITHMQQYTCVYICIYIHNSYIYIYIYYMTIYTVWWDASYYMYIILYVLLLVTLWYAYKLQIYIYYIDGIRTINTYVCDQILCKKYVRVFDAEYINMYILMVRKKNCIPFGGYWNIAGSCFRVNSSEDMKQSGKKVFPDASRMV